MLEQKKEYQSQIRLTKAQYDYLQKTKAAKHCTTSAYFRALLVADMNKSNTSNTGEK